MTHWVEFVISFRSPQRPRNASFSIGRRFLFRLVEELIAPCRSTPIKSTNMRLLSGGNVASSRAAFASVISLVSPKNLSPSIPVLERPSNPTTLRWPRRCDRGHHSNPGCAAVCSAPHPLPAPFRPPPASSHPTLSTL